MNRTLLESEEGTHTVLCDVAGETFQSLNRPLKESIHVFINNGLMRCIQKKMKLNILEIGFGSGLTALLTMKYLDSIDGSAQYTATEFYPLDMSLISRINYFNYIDRKYRSAYFDLHTSPWNEWIEAGSLSFRKIKCDSSKTIPEGKFDLIYFDAFSVEADPAIWTASVFKMIYDQMRDEGVMVIRATEPKLIEILTKIGFKTEVSVDNDFKFNALIAIK